MDGNDVKAMLLAAADAMDAARDELCALDGEIGDADHGVAMAGGFGAIRTALVELDGVAPTEVLNAAAKAFLNAVGASSGPLYATAFMRAGAAVKGKDVLGDGDAPGLIVAMAEGIAHRGKAERGDKTMLDAWGPASDAATASAGKPAATVFHAAADAAEAGAEATVEMQARLGRAARLGARSLGHKDPGAASAAVLLRAMARTLEES
ncbi:dihydroxyacetone kinase subunit DhaL [Ruegeria arenilitoris]|uniref:dihydroxyacetone kinase subunit DhaL n=1 Tax=Ruegeria arenilitoris TaxID=1173585 RepID=UPI00147DD1BB|nr:dihydroxyacetone kinase subunit DhaL [Ruegeria arenilitoris]